MVASLKSSLVHMIFEQTPKAVPTVVNLSEFIQTNSHLLIGPMGPALTDMVASILKNHSSIGTVNLFGDPVEALKVAVGDVFAGVCNWIPVSETPALSDGKQTADSLKEALNIYLQRLRTKRTSGFDETDIAWLSENAGNIVFMVLLVQEWGEQPTVDEDFAWKARDLFRLVFGK